MRASIDVRHLGLPGVGRFATELARALVIEAGPGDDIIPLVPRRAPRGWLGSAALRAEGPVRAWSRPFEPLEQIELPRLLRRERIDLHHATHLSLPLASPVPVVLTVHDLFPLIDSGHARSPAAAAYYRTVLPWAIRRATATVAVSDYTAAEMERVLRVTPDAVIGHGVDHAAWRQSRAGAGDAPAEGTAGDAPAEGTAGDAGSYLLYVGTTKAHKNLATLLRAHAGGRGRRGERLPRLVLAGPTPQEVNRLLPGVLANSQVQALGRVQDGALPGWYRGAAVVAVPSLHEGVGLAALEAMSFGVPVVAADSPGLRDTVGEAGILVPPTDPAAWADALSRAAADSSFRSVLIERGRGWAGKHRWADAARSYLDLYRQVLVGVAPR
jgi:glycosyltransferase involved in cell wall biosynthesis